MFTGTFVEVTPYSAATVMVHSDRASATNGLVLQWSTDGINVDDEQAFNYAGSAAGLGLVIHATVRASYFRMKYTNTGLSQSFLRLQTLLRRETPQGSIGYIGQGITSNDDALVTKAVIAARDIQTPTNIVLPFASSDPFLIVAAPPNTGVVWDKTVAASLSSVQLDQGFLDTTRRAMTVLNDTVLGTLYIRMAGAASLTAHHAQVPPKHTWTLPNGWVSYGGDVFGIWDVADGSARVMEYT